MTERPILFSAPMVRAILSGTKTQTRRVVKATNGRPIDFLGGGPVGGPDWNNPQCWGYEHHDSATWVLLQADSEVDTAQYPYPYGQPGDRLWVREAFRLARGYDQLSPLALIEMLGSGEIGIHYECNGPAPSTAGKLRPGIHMPRSFSRITLEVTGVRVERLQDISEADAQAEGARECDPVSGREVLLAGPSQRGSFRLHYRDIWEQINGPGSWEANPWVWCVSFRRIDAS